MKFYTRKKASPIVPIVSLIDILAILLIFFIVTTTFKTKKALLNIALPKSSELEADGTPVSRMTISVTAEKEVYVEDEAVAVEDLARALLALKEARPEMQLELRADENIPLGFLVLVWDALNQSGFKIQEVPARIQLGGEG
ncbi:MAG: biopolymer transporter ExbD [Verrucomicrobiota bacterium]